MSLAALEYAALRQTVAIRGTVRMALVPLGIGGWAALGVVLLLHETSAVSFVGPLLVLGATFEAVHALHAGVERIGRYLQVRYESAGDGPLWERTAMAVGPALPGGGIDPLFTVVFVAALAANFGAALIAPGDPLTWLALAGAHAAALVRIGRARHAAARQRSTELARMSDILQPKVRKTGAVEADFPDH